MSVGSRERKGEELHFRIHEKDVAALKRVAERNDRSMSAEVRRAIRAYVAAQDRAHLEGAV